MESFEVDLQGGGPWGFRLQGGKDFRQPLSVSRITPGGKAAVQGIEAGDMIYSINGELADSMTHLDAQNCIKNAGQDLKLYVQRKGDNNNRSPIVITQTTHSAKSDHKFNVKPRPFGAPASSPSSSPSPPQSVSPAAYHPPAPPPPPAPPAAPPAHVSYASPRKQPSAHQVPDESEVLKRLHETRISDDNAGLKSAASNVDSYQREMNRLQLATSDGDDTEYMGYMKQPEESGLSRAKVQSKSFKMLQHHLGTDDDLPPPPPEAYLEGPGEDSQHQSRTFQMLQHSVDGGTESHPSVFSRAFDDRSKASNIPLPKQYQPSNPTPIKKAGQENMATVSHPGAPLVLPGQPQPVALPGMVKKQPAAPTSPGSVIQSTPALHKPPSSRTGPVPAPPPPPGQYGIPPPRGGNVPHNPPPTVHGPPKSGGGGPRGPAPGGPRAGAPKAAGGRDGPRTPYCDGCNEPINGPFVSAIGRSWHPEHFRCASCDRPLQDIGFVEEQGKLYCEEDYNQYFAPRCADCNQPIIGEYGKHLCNVPPVSPKVMQPMSPRVVRPPPVHRSTSQSSSADEGPLTSPGPLMSPKRPSDKSSSVQLSLKRPSPAKPSPIQQTPVQPSPTQQPTVQPSPARPSPIQQSPVQPSPARPSPTQQPTVQPSPARPSPIQQPPVQPSSARPSPVQQSTVKLFPTRPSPSTVPSDTALKSSGPFRTAPITGKVPERSKPIPQELPTSQSPKPLGGQQQPGSPQMFQRKNAPSPVQTFQPISSPRGPMSPHRVQSPQSPLNLRKPQSPVCNGKPPSSPKGGATERLQQSIIQSPFPLMKHLQGVTVSKDIPHLAPFLGLRDASGLPIAGDSEFKGVTLVDMAINLKNEIKKTEQEAVDYKEAKTVAMKRRNDAERKKYSLKEKIQRKEEAIEHVERKVVSVLDKLTARQRHIDEVNRLKTRQASILTDDERDLEILKIELTMYRARADQAQQKLLYVQHLFAQKMHMLKEIEEQVESKEDKVMSLEYKLSQMKERQGHVVESSKMTDYNQNWDAKRLMVLEHQIDLSRKRMYYAEHRVKQLTGRKEHMEDEIRSWMKNNFQIRDTLHSHKELMEQFYAQLASY